LRVDEGMLKLSLTVYDRDDRLLVVIEDNEWLSGDPLPWDIEASFQRLTLREKARTINLGLNARSIPPFLAAELWKGACQSTPTSGILFDACCARTASGHATVEPAIPRMNSRRRIAFPRLKINASYRLKIAHLTELAPRPLQAQDAVGGGVQLFLQPPFLPTCPAGFAAARFPI
jgi:hypothetical protein